MNSKSPLLIFILLLGFHPAANGSIRSEVIADEKLLDSTLVESLEEDSIFIYRLDYPDYTEWKLAHKTPLGFITTLLNEPNDAMGIESMSLTKIDIHDQISSLVRIDYFISKEHFYGGTGGWAYGESGFILRDLEMDKEIFRCIYDNYTGDNLVEFDSTGENILNESHHYCQYSYDVEFDSKANILIKNLYTSKSEESCALMNDHDEGFYEYKKDRYVRKED